jgi:ABC-2 type transport system ATP-binding protein
VASALPVLARLGVTGLRVQPPSLEELFLRHYGDDLPAGSTDTRVDAGSRRDRRAAAGR